MRRSQPHNMSIQRDVPPKGLPWPQDSFRMAVTSFDLHAKRDVTFEVLFAPPFYASWATAAFQVLLAPKISRCVTAGCIAAL